MSNPLMRAFNPPANTSQNSDALTKSRALSSPSAPVVVNGVQAQFGVNSQHNPFAVALKSDSQAFLKSYGVNQPLPKNMFVGYWGDQAVYAGAQMFLLA